MRPPGTTIQGRSIQGKGAGPLAKQGTHRAPTDEAAKRTDANYSPRHLRGIASRIARDKAMK